MFRQWMWEATMTITCGEVVRVFVVLSILLQAATHIQHVQHTQQTHRVVVAQLQTTAL
jgi:hypothetical protein